MNDLEIAQRAINRMKEATKFPVFHEAWQDYLGRIERAWEAAARGLQGAKGFQQWFKPYTEQKSSDPLLVFLFQARHAETHALGTTMDKPLAMIFREKHGYPFRLESVKQTLEGRNLTIDINTAPEDSLLSYEAKLVPTQPTLVRFENRNNWFDPPDRHLGNPLKSKHPVVVAELGLAFYSSFIKEASFRFLSVPS